MADELQALLNRINEEGLKQADTARQEVLDKARAEAERLLQTAHRDSERMVEQAKREAELLVAKGRQSLQQAARDVILSLREQLQARLQAVAKTCAGEAMTPEAMANMVVELARGYAARGGDVERLDVLLSETQRGDLERHLKARLQADLREHCQVSPVPGAEGGFKLIFNGDDVVYDFSTEALAEALAVFLSPRLADLLRSAAP